MSENPESAAQQHDISTPKPTVEKEVGQYSGGDYGEGGTVSQDQTGPESGGYAEGNYGDGGTAGDQLGPESGGYAEGDYGEGGTVGEQAGAATGGYAEGDYGEGETERPSGGGDGALDAEDAVPGPADDDTEGTGRKA